MKNSYKIIIGSIAFFAFLVVVLFGYKALNYTQRADYTELSMTELNAKIENAESFMLVVGSAECGACIAYNPVVQAFMHGKDEPLFHLETSTLTEAEHKLLTESLDIEVTPTTIFFIGGKKAAALPGKITHGELDKIFTQYRKLVDANESDSN